MEITLIRHGHVDYDRAIDRFAAGLSARGRAEAERAARQCAAWAVQLLVASTIVSSEQTADAILAAIPDAVRWDLDELQDVGIEEQAIDPLMHPLSEHWSEGQRALAYERTWVRVTSALARIEIYCRTYGLERVAIVAHQDVLNLILLYGLGLDWRQADRVRFSLDPGASVRLVVADGATRIDWMNRPA